MKRQHGHILMAAGGFLLLCAATLLGSYIWEDYQAQQKSAQLVRQLQSRLSQNASASREMPDEEPQLPVSEEPQTEVSADDEAAQEASKEAVYLLEIPAQDITLAVLGEYSEELLKQAPCRYGAENCSPGQIVIAGHNYRSHFRCLSRLQLGDEIFLTTTDGQRTRYEVSAFQEISGNDPDALFVGTWDLTLFTCALNRQNRVVIRCRSDNSV